MKVFAIGDLHLSGASHKPMDIFGEVWANHVAILTNHWTKIVSAEDLVLVPGDISWAMRLGEAQVDLDRIEQLPGHKVCIRGNHDYWWDRPGRLNARYEKLYFLQNVAYMTKEYALCGSRGWTCPSRSWTYPNRLDFTKEDEKILNRELIRLQLSLDDAVKNKAKEIIVMLHYPPTYRTERESPFTLLFEKYPITHVVYGHLHDEMSWHETMQGQYKGINYHLVSADYLKFLPIRIK